MEEKSKKKKLKGIVVSDKNDKTAIILVNRFAKHKKYGKFVKSGKRYKAHDENNKYKVGDKVTIEESKSFSKDKKFKVL